MASNSRQPILIETQAQHDRRSLERDVMWAVIIAVATLLVSVLGGGKW